MFLKYFKNSYISLLHFNFLKGYTHISSITNGEGLDEITTSNDCTKKTPIFGNFFLYRGWKKYLEDNLDKIGETKDKLDLKDVIKWTKEMTNSILDPINGNNIKSLKELEDLLVETYGAGKVHKYIDENGKEYNIRFATSFNIKGTTILRNDGNINIEGGITPKATHNLGNDNFVGIDAIGWSSITVAPTGGYNKNEKGKKINKHEDYGILGKIPKLRPKEVGEFKINLYKKIMNLPIKIEFKGFAYESNRDEIVIMPTFTINGKEIEEEIKQFSQKIPKGKTAIPTSKKYLADL